MTLHITGCDGTYLHTIVEENHTALSIDLHLSYIFALIPTLEGIRIQEGSLSASSYTFRASS